jgi:toxin ParE1/3/4
MVSYRLSEDAAGDLDLLYEYGILNYGLDVANQYYDGLIKRFEEIAENPNLYRAVDYIRAGYRLSIYGVNSIYYRFEQEGIFIVRILRKQNPENI